MDNNLSQSLSKYPRTFHLPFSPGKSSDDKTLSSLSQFNNKRIIITEKMDGENTTLYRDYWHPRSTTPSYHYTRTWVIQLWSTIRFEIPENYRICGENLYATHSIHYDNLSGYFYVFSVWNQNVCLSWDDTVKFANQLNLPLVPVLYDGMFSEQIIRQTIQQLNINTQEGIVVRVADSFDLSHFTSFVGKWVRPNHVQINNHWKHNTNIQINGVKQA